MAANRAAGVVSLSVAVVLLAGCSVERHESDDAPAHAWVQEGFTQFSKGQFDDAGANAYVSAAGNIQQIHRWDLNRDGFIDLVFANTHAQAEKLDAALYWGNGKDFDSARVSYIPNEGAQWTTTGDLDGDGRLDAVMASYTNGTWSNQESSVYFGGGERGQPFDFRPFARKLGLPTMAAQRAAIADLNRDGYPDIVFAMSAGFWEYRGGNALASPSRIFWGSKEGFSRERFTDLEAVGAADVAVADLNKDGWPDIVFANRERGGKEKGDSKFDIESFVYWGSKEGFSPERRTGLPTNQVNAVAIADVNNDGYGDVIFANGAGSASSVYINDHGSFDAKRRVNLPSSDARGCAAADVNGDGYADVFITNYQVAGNQQTKSYLYWGSASGFAADKRQEFETVGACGVSIGDLNEDGRPDIVVSNFSLGTTMDIPSYIYWNSKDGFSDSLRTSLFTHGAVGNTIGDFDGDGHVDVLFNNTMAGSRGGMSPSYVYFGDTKGNYSPRRRLELPAVEPYGWGAADLNDDGWPELVFANEAETGRHITENFIYWGGDQGFSVDRRSALVSDGAKSVNFADLDRDGYLDVVLLNCNPDPGMVIYFGSKDGFVATQRTILTSGGAGFPAIADVNGDGNLDIVVAGGSPKSDAIIYFGDGTRGYSSSRSTKVPDSKNTANVEVADMNRDGHLDLILNGRGGPGTPSYIYYGDGHGQFTTTNRSTFYPLETQGVTVADVNRDGYLDIICPRYKNAGSRKTMSRIYLGSARGITEDNILELPTYGGTGSMVADFNHDGYPDLLLTCHRFEGDANKIGATSDHVTDSFLYWGGKDGFKADRKLLIPTRGAHYDCGVDLGNIYDRSPRFDYISVAHEYGAHHGARIAWTAQTPPGSAIRFQIRTARSQAALDGAKWLGPGGEATWFDRSGAALKTKPGDSWIQYRARFSSRDGADSARLERVALTFDQNTER